MSAANYLARYNDAELRALYRSIDGDRVKTGKNKGHVTMRGLRLEGRLVLEATRRGAEYPHNWLAQ